ncbi:hypothetical protein [Rhodococcus sp. NPDC127528]|uniref:hypothetical protein n=1 Tax=unclassified Rhodococcus (in: high G+C Gram-positive bacteria) TaxID=192944 RepID=UPI003628EBBE
MTAESRIGASGRIRGLRSAAFAAGDAEAAMADLADDVEWVVALTQVTLGGESWDSADVLTFRAGKVVKFQSAGDTAKLEKVFGAR